MAWKYLSMVRPCFHDNASFSFDEAYYIIFDNLPMLLVSYLNKPNHDEGFLCAFF